MKWWWTQGHTFWFDVPLSSVTTLWSSHHLFVRKTLHLTRKIASRNTSKMHTPKWRFFSKKSVAKWTKQLAALRDLFQKFYPQGSSWKTSQGIRHTMILPEWLTEAISGKKGGLKIRPPRDLLGFPTKLNHVQTRLGVPNFETYIITQGWPNPWFGTRFISTIRFQCFCWLQVAITFIPPLNKHQDPKSGLRSPTPLQSVSPRQVSPGGSWGSWHRVRCHNSIPMCKISNQKQGGKSSHSIFR